MGGVFDFILHLDIYLGELISAYGTLVYLILFAFIFCETGLVVTPFLPGDSLLFAAGAFCAAGALNLAVLLIIAAVAAILGDTVNYWIGKSLRNLLKDENRLKFIKREYLNRTSDFFERHGGKTIVLARFIPIIRTFTPFVAGAGKMNYRHFIVFNILGGSLWSSMFILGGLFFGGLPIIKKNFSFVIIAVILISLLPIVISKIVSNKKKKEACEK
ncbi:MAG: DedA family protein [Bacillota bacterium]|nr:DedA family protein [Bacillota bacterium]